jgi:hypothetical protein
MRPLEDQVYESHWQSQFWNVDGARTAISGSSGVAVTTAQSKRVALTIFIMFSLSNSKTNWIVCGTAGAALYRSVQTRPEGQGCQMAYFQTKNPNLGKFLRICNGKMLVYYEAIWSVFRPFVVFCGRSVYFMAIWYVIPREIWQPVRRLVLWLCATRWGKTMLPLDSSTF